MNGPFTAFSWGVAGVFVGGQIIDTDTTFGYIVGIPICIMGFLSLKHLGQRLIFMSSFKLAAVALVVMFASLYVGGEVINVHYISQLIIAVGGSLIITAMVQIYYKIYWEK
jgi:hypothetical protein